MNEKILVSGCSYTAGAAWPSVLFPDCTITNLGRSGAGNKYISDSVIKLIDPTTPPDFVFVLFSGVNRSDVIVPLNSGTKKFAEIHGHYGIIHDSIYFFSGGDQYSNLIIECYDKIKANAPWPLVNSCDDFLNLPLEIKQECLQHDIIDFVNWDIGQFIHSALMINYFSNTTFLQNQTYQAIINCQNFLENHSIPYGFSFFYDPFDYDYANQFGCLDKKNPLYKQVNWNKFINCFPFEVGMEFDLLEHDGVHLTIQGQQLWAQRIADRVIKENNTNALHFWNLSNYFKNN